MLAVFFSILPGGTTSADVPSLLPTSQNDPSGLAEWKPSGIPSTAILRSQCFSQFQLSQRA